MRILLLDHPQHTSGTWVLYEGLKRVLGWEALVVFPRKESLHGRNHDLMTTQWYRDVYQDIADGYDLPRGIPPLAPGESLTTNDERLISCFAVPNPSITPDPQREYGEEEVIAELDAGRFDLVVLGNSHRVPTIALARLRDRCRQLPPVVYLDAGERDEHCSHWTHAFRPALVFKQILTPAVERQYRSDFKDLHVPLKLWPLPLANAFTHHPSLSPNIRAVLDAPVAPRQHDVFSHFGWTWHERNELQARVLKKVSELGASLSGPGKAGFFEEMYEQYLADERAADERAAGSADPDTRAQFNRNVFAPYFVVLSRSRIGVSMRGSGRDTDRYWDIPAFGPALLADGTMGCVHPHPHRDGETAVFYRTYEEMERKLEWLVRDEGARVAISAAGREHARRFHCVEARALFFLAIVRQVTGVGDARLPQAEAWRARLGWGSELPEWHGPAVGFGDGA